MEKLMKPAEYAKELGISRQAVYAKIKRGILTARNVDGKLYIVVDKEAEATKESTAPAKQKAASKAAKSDTQNIRDYKALLEAKDETIAVLKDTVRDLKESNREISTTLRGEVDLLKEAFHEMRTLYIHQLEHKGKEEAIDIDTEHEDSVHEDTMAEGSWVGLKKFFKQLGVTKSKQQEKIAKMLKKAYKQGDSRLLKEKGKIRINTMADYKDLVK